MSRNLVEAGYTTFDRIAMAHPRDLEKVLSRAPPFGTRLIGLIQRLPRYSMTIQQVSSYSRQQAQLNVQIQLANPSESMQNGLTTGQEHRVVFLVSDEDNNIIRKTLLK